MNKKILSTLSIIFVLLVNIPFALGVPLRKATITVSPHYRPDTKYYYLSSDSASGPIIPTSEAISDYLDSLENGHYQCLIKSKMIPLYNNQVGTLIDVVVIHKIQECKRI